MSIYKRKSANQASVKQNQEPTHKSSPYNQLDAANNHSTSKSAPGDVAETSPPVPSSDPALQNPTTASNIPKARSSIYSRARKTQSAASPALQQSPQSSKSLTGDGTRDGTRSNATPSLISGLQYPTSLAQKAQFIRLVALTNPIIERVHKESGEDRDISAGLAESTHGDITPLSAVSDEAPPTQTPPRIPTLTEMYWKNNVEFFQEEMPSYSDYQVFILARDVGVYEYLHGITPETEGPRVCPTTQLCSELTRRSNEEISTTHSGQQHNRSDISLVQAYYQSISSMSADMAQTASQSTPFRDTNHHDQGDGHMAMHRDEHHALLNGCLCGLVCVSLQSKWFQHTAPELAYPALPTDQDNRGSSSTDDTNHPHACMTIIPNLLRRGDTFHVVNPQILSLSQMKVHPHTYLYDLYPEILDGNIDCDPIGGSAVAHSPLTTQQQLLEPLSGSNNDSSSPLPPTGRSPTAYTQDSNSKTLSQPDASHQLYHMLSQSIVTPDTPTPPVSQSAFWTPASLPTQHGSGSQPPVWFTPFPLLSSQQLLPKDTALLKRSMRLLSMIKTTSSLYWQFVKVFILLYWPVTVSTPVSPPRVSLSSHCHHHTQTLTRMNVPLSLCLSPPPLLVVGDKSLLVLAPHVQIPATTVAAGLDCQRRAFLKEVFPGNNDSVFLGVDPSPSLRGLLLQQRYGIPDTIGVLQHHLQQHHQQSTQTPPGNDTGDADTSSTHTYDTTVDQIRAILLTEATKRCPTTKEKPNQWQSLLNSIRKVITSYSQTQPSHGLSTAGMLETTSESEDTDLFEDEAAEDGLFEEESPPEDSACHPTNHRDATSGVAAVHRFSLANPQVQWAATKGNVFHDIVQGLFLSGNAHLSNLLGITSHVVSSRWRDFLQAASCEYLVSRDSVHMLAHKLTPPPPTPSAAVNTTPPPSPPSFKSPAFVHLCIEPFNSLFQLYKDIMSLLPSVLSWGFVNYRVAQQTATTSPMGVYASSSFGLDLSTLIQQLSQCMESSSPLTLESHPVIEQTVFSTTFGLNGRIDALVEASEKLRHQPTMNGFRSQMVSQHRGGVAQSQTQSQILSHHQSQMQYQSQQRTQTYVSSSTSSSASQYHSSTTHTTLKQLTVAQQQQQQQQQQQPPSTTAGADNSSFHLIPIEIKSSSYKRDSYRVQSMIYSMVLQDLTRKPSTLTYLWFLQDDSREASEKRFVWKKVQQSFCNVMEKVLGHATTTIGTPFGVEAVDPPLTSLSSPSSLSLSSSVYHPNDHQLGHVLSLYSKFLRYLNTLWRFMVRMYRQQPQVMVIPAILYTNSDQQLFTILRRICEDIPELRRLINHITSSNNNSIGLVSDGSDHGGDAKAQISPTDMKFDLASLVRFPTLVMDHNMGDTALNSVANVHHDDILSQSSSINPKQLKFTTQSDDDDDYDFDRLDELISNPSSAHLPLPYHGVLEEQDRSDLTLPPVLFPLQININNRSNQTVPMEATSNSVNTTSHSAANSDPDLAQDLTARALGMGSFLKLVPSHAEYIDILMIRNSIAVAMARIDGGDFLACTSHDYSHLYYDHPKYTQSVNRVPTAESTPGLARHVGDRVSSLTISPTLTLPVVNCQWTSASINSTDSQTVSFPPHQTELALTCTPKSPFELFHPPQILNILPDYHRSLLPPMTTVSSQCESCYHSDACAALAIVEHHPHMLQHTIEDVVDIEDTSLHCSLRNHTEPIKHRIGTTIHGDDIPPSCIDDDDIFSLVVGQSGSPHGSFGIPRSEISQNNEKTMISSPITTLMSRFEYSLSNVVQFVAHYIKLFLMDVGPYHALLAHSHGFRFFYPQGHTEHPRNLPFSHHHFNKTRGITPRPPLLSEPIASVDLKPQPSPLARLVIRTATFSHETQAFTYTFSILGQDDDTAVAAAAIASPFSNSNPIQHDHEEDLTTIVSVGTYVSISARARAGFLQDGGQWKTPWAKDMSLSIGPTPHLQQSSTSVTTVHTLGSQLSQIQSRATATPLATGPHLSPSSATHHVSQSYSAIHTHSISQMTPSSPSSFQTCLSNVCAGYVTGVSPTSIDVTVYSDHHLSLADVDDLLCDYDGDSHDGHHKPSSYHLETPQKTMILPQAHDGGKAESSSHCLEKSVLYQFLGHIERSCLSGANGHDSKSHSDHTSTGNVNANALTRYHTPIYHQVHTSSTAPPPYTRSGPSNANDQQQPPPFHNWVFKLSMNPPSSKASLRMLSSVLPLLRTNWKHAIVSLPYPMQRWLLSHHEAAQAYHASSQEGKPLVVEEMSTSRVSDVLCDGYGLVIADAKVVANNMLATLTANSQYDLNGVDVTGESNTTPLTNILHLMSSSIRVTHSAQPQHIQQTQSLLIDFNSQISLPLQQGTSFIVAADPFPQAEVASSAMLRIRKLLIHHVKPRFISFTQSDIVNTLVQCIRVVTPRLFSSSADLLTAVASVHPDTTTGGSTTHQNRVMSDTNSWNSLFGASTRQTLSDILFDQHNTPMSPIPHGDSHHHTIHLCLCPPPTSKSRHQSHPPVHPPAIRLVPQQCSCIRDFMAYLFHQLDTVYSLVVLASDIPSNATSDAVSATSFYTPVEKLTTFCYLLTEIQLHNIAQFCSFYTSAIGSLRQYITDLAADVDGTTTTPALTPSALAKYSKYSVISLSFPYLTNVTDIARKISALNSEQQTALVHAFTPLDYSIIQGVPGSGKTAVISVMIQIMRGLGQRVLITSSTNFAVNGVVERLLRDAPGIDSEIIRVTPVSSRVVQDKTNKNSQQSRLELLTLSNIIEHAKSDFQHSPYARHYFSSEPWPLPSDTSGYGSDHGDTEPASNSSASLPSPQQRIPTRCYPDLPLSSQLSFVVDQLHYRSIVSSTIASLGSSTSELMNLSLQSFDCIIIDEASQLTVPQTIQACQSIAPLGRFILIGDTEQLPPLVLNPLSERSVRYALPLSQIPSSSPSPSHSNPQHTHRTLSGLQKSFMNILCQQHPHCAVYIRSQYRMNGVVMSLVNSLVYNHGLRCATEAVRTKRLVVSMNLPFLQTVLGHVSSQLQDGGTTRQLLPMDDSDSNHICSEAPLMRAKRSNRTSSQPDCTPLGDQGSQSCLSSSSSPSVKRQKYNETPQSPSSARLGSPVPPHATPGAVNTPDESSFFYELLTPENPLVFINVPSIGLGSELSSTDVSNTQQQSASHASLRPALLPLSTAMCNVEEAIVVLITALSFLLSGIPSNEIAILSPYKDQTAYISKLFRHAQTTATQRFHTAFPSAAPDNAEETSPPIHVMEALSQLTKIGVYTVDQSQGLDVEIVIISSVLSPLSTKSEAGAVSSPSSTPAAATTAAHRSTGLLTDKNRVNVALTRSRNKLILVGNVLSFLLSSQPHVSSNNQQQEGSEQGYLGYLLPQRPTIFSRVTHFMTQHGRFVPLPSSFFTTQWQHHSYWSAAPIRSHRTAPTGDDSKASHFEPC